MRKTRVAVYGGDERNERLDWPRHLDMQFYPYKSSRAVERLKESLSSGSIDHLVVLTSYVGHGHAAAFKGYEVDTVLWPRSPGQLCRELAQMIPPKEAPPPNPLLAPTRPDHPGTGGGRGPVTPKEARMSEPEAPNVPMFEHVIVTEPPKPDETFGQALLRILKAEGMSQADLGRLVNKDASTVNGWIKDRGLPADMGPLVDLWPELARFDRTRTYKVPPTAAEAEVKAAEELKESIRAIKAEPTVARPVLRPAAPPPTQVTPEVAVALARWRRAKEELAAIETHLLFLLRESGL